MYTWHTHSLLKAHALEARSIVRQALDILTPVVPIRMEDANATLVHWTKKIIVEEGHSVAQLIHMLWVDWLSLVSWLSFSDNYN